MSSNWVCDVILECGCVTGNLLSQEHKQHEHLIRRIDILCLTFDVRLRQRAITGTIRSHCTGQRSLCHGISLIFIYLVQSDCFDYRQALQSGAVVQMRRLIRSLEDHSNGLLLEVVRLAVCCIEPTILSKSASIPCRVQFLILLQPDYTVILYENVQSCSRFCHNLPSPCT